MSNPSVDVVIAHWKAQDVPYLPGVSGDELSAFENEHRVTLPDDVRAFYLATDGTRVPMNPGCDRDWYEFYRLSDVAPDAQYAWAMNFADYMMLSWWFAIDLTGAGGHGAGAVYFMGATGGQPLIVARSFTEFLDLYVSADDRLGPDGAKKYHRMNRRRQL